MNPQELLDARRAAIEKVVQDCGGGTHKDTTKDPVEACVIMIAREAAGKGFDEGVKLMAAHAEKLTVNPRE